MVERRSRPHRAQSPALRGLPRRVASLLRDLADELRAGLGRNLVGLYVYGSLTQGQFDPRRSDIDSVAVIRRGLSRGVTSRLRGRLRRLGRREPLLRRLQLTILIQRELLRFNGDGWLYQYGRLTHPGSDGNPIIWADILDAGLVILGTNPRSFVPAITPEAMRAALNREVGYLREELLSKPDSTWRKRPAYRRYAALTLCRILYTSKTGRLAPKRVAAVWALQRLPAIHRPTVRRAMAQPQQAGLLPLHPLRALLSHVEQRLAAAPNAHPSSHDARLSSKRGRL